MHVHFHIYDNIFSANGYNTRVLPCIILIGNYMWL